MVALALFKLRWEPAHTVLFLRLPADGVYRDGVLAGGHGKRGAEPVKSPLRGGLRRLLKAYAEALKAAGALLGLILKPLYPAHIVLAAPGALQQLRVYPLVIKAGQKLLLSLKPLSKFFFRPEIGIIPEYRDLEILCQKLYHRA